MESLREKLAKHKIRYIPIFYKCSLESVVNIHQKKKLNFQALELSEMSAKLYQVYSLSQTFVFDNQGKLISEDFNEEDIK